MKAIDTPPFVFLHGLTFDHRMWEPVIAALPAESRAIALDLPGHGGVPLAAAPGLAPVVDVVHEAVMHARLDRPIVVGHSIGGPLASIYASTYPAAAVVSIEAPIQVEPFAATLQALRPQLEGPNFAQAWIAFQQSWHMELLSRPRRELLVSSEHPSQEVVLSYQADVLERPLDEVLRWRDAGMQRLAEVGLPYLSIHSNPVDPAEQAWLAGRIPQAEVVVWPVRHHFPQLADPEAFAGLLVEVAEKVIELRPVSLPAL
jgi:pimeloyl-ACP methyl ester carboxylesterase